MFTMEMLAFVLVLLQVFRCAHCAENASESDFVIVGAGTAGCVLAARLCTLLPSHTFALLERSPPRSPDVEFLVRSPRKMWESWRSPSVVDIFETVPSPGLLNRSLNVFTGRTLGGSSSINAMQWVVPIEGNVESWGIRGLSTRSSRPFYKRAFDTVGFAAQTGNLQHLYARDVVEAAGKAGFPESLDPFDAKNERNIFENRLAIDPQGRRRDSCTAYLQPALKKECKHNLRLIQGVTATRILFTKRKRRRAIGLEYARSEDKLLNHRMTIRAAKEVLLSAGPFESPKLLQLSGLGPPKVLKKAGIEMVAPLPVGTETFARSFVGVDSLYTGVPLEPSNNSTLINSEEARRQWESGRGGVLGKGSFLTNGRDRKNGYTTGVGHFSPESVDQPILSISCNGNVKSSGYLRVSDANPFTAPEVQLGLLSEQEDVDRLERCVKRLVKVHRMFPERFQLSFLAPTNGEVNQTWIRTSAGWSGHYVGGCSVGSVVRPDLTVRKVLKLRVIDSSVFRTMPLSAGPMASTYMLAEYIAEQIANLHK